jgi:hypothetical protein
MHLLNLRNYGLLNLYQHQIKMSSFLAQMQRVTISYVMRLILDRGTLLFRGNVTDAESLPGVLWDPRVETWRARACHYKELSMELARRHIDFHDEVCPQLPNPLPITHPELRPYQAAAIASCK